MVRMCSRKYLNDFVIAPITELAGSHGSNKSCLFTQLGQKVSAFCSFLLDTFVIHVNVMTIYGKMRCILLILKTNQGN